MSQDALLLIENQVLFADFRPLKEVSGANYPGVISKEKELYGDSRWVKHNHIDGFAVRDNDRPIF